MHYRQLGRTGIAVSEIGLGALELGRDWGIPIEGDFGRPDEQDPISLVHRALDPLIQPDWSLGQAALEFVLAAEAVSTTISGTRKIGNLESNVAAAEDNLSPNDIQRLETMEGNA